MLTFFTALLGTFIAPKVMATLGGVLGLILANLILGVLLSMKTGTFDVRKLPQFLETNFVPYIGGLLILALFSGMDPSLTVLFFTITALVYAKYLAMIKDQLVQLFGVPTVAPESVKIDSSVIVPVPDTVAPVADIVSPAPKTIIDSARDTLDVVGERAKTMAVDDLTAKLSAVLQEAATPVVTSMPEATTPDQSAV